MYITFSEPANPLFVFVGLRFADQGRCCPVLELVKLLLLAEVVPLVQRFEVLLQEERLGADLLAA